MLWVVWLLATVTLGVWLAYVMLNESTNKGFFMPGALSAGHQQLELACEVCHADPLGGKEVLQETCINCHGDERKARLSLRLPPSRIVVWRIVRQTLDTC